MVKPMLIILPVLLLIVDFWPLRRLSASTFTQMLRSCLTLSMEKAPYWFLALVGLSTTLFHAKQHQVVVGPSWINRTENALVSLVSYLAKLFWPENLGMYYPLRDSYFLWEVAGASVLLVFITLLAWRFRQSRPWFLAGWAWYIICLMPVLGFIRTNLWPSMADRFAYFPQLGIIVIALFAIAELKAGRAYSVVAGALSLCVIITLSIITARQITYWENSLTLINRAIAVTENNMIMERFRAMHNRGAYPPDMIYVKRKLEKAYKKQLEGDSAEALEEYHKIADLGIDSKALFHNMALLYKKMNDTEKYNYYSEKALKAGSLPITQP